MENNCPNCNQIIEGNFCGNCGQKKYTRIDKKYILDEFQYILHANKGFLYSIKKLIVNPGKTAREFIDGNRINHHQPISLAFVLSGISAYISFKIVDFNGILKEMYSKREMYSDYINDLLSFIGSFISFILLFLIPVFAFFSKIAFKKWGNNYYEHVVMYAFILSFHTLIDTIVLLPVVYLAKDNAIIEVFTFLPMSAIPFVLVWFYKGFYKEHSLISILWRVFLMLFMALIAYMCFIFAITFLYARIFGIEAMQQMQ